LKKGIWERVLQEEEDIDHFKEIHPQDHHAQDTNLQDFLTHLIDILVLLTLIIHFVTALTADICLFLIITMMLMMKLMFTQ
jgi:hypothetical protein